MGYKKILYFYLFPGLTLAMIAMLTAVFLKTTRPTHSPVHEEPPVSFQASLVEKANCYLYFSDPGHTFLMAEERPFVQTGDPAQLGKSIIDALIGGPRENLIRTLPSEATLRAFYLAQDGTAYVDLAENIETCHPGGSKLEYFTIYSIVNSLIVNIPQIKAVKFLLGGHEARTLSGHIDILMPFKANMLLVR